MDGLVADLEAKLLQNRMGGGEKALARMRSKGKKLPRERCIMVSFISMHAGLHFIHLSGSPYY